MPGDSQLTKIKRMNVAESIHSQRQDQIQCRLDGMDTMSTLGKWSGDRTSPCEWPKI